jgi:hypothetical protein
MKKLLIVSGLLAIMIGVACIVYSLSYKDFFEIDLFLYSTGLISVAFFARKKFMKK